MGVMDSAMSGTAARRFLDQLGLCPILVDVGAAAAPPAIWDPIAARSAYVGFDPDHRDTPEPAAGHFRHAFLVREAVVGDAGLRSTPLYLTRFPHLSSTLPPDPAAIEPYHYAELFGLEAKTVVPATTLGEALGRLGLPAVDWLKLDSQGMDLCIFRGMAPTLRDRVLALDVEPGVIDAYVDNEQFVDVHPALRAEGFWLSRMDVLGVVRISQATLRRARATYPWLGSGPIGRSVRASPGWCEARYLRTVEWLDASDAAPRQYALLWLFAMIDAQPGFALDVAVAYLRRFGEDPTARFMEARALRAIGGAGLRRKALLAGKGLARLALFLRRYAHDRAAALGY